MSVEGYATGAFTTLTEILDEQLTSGQDLGASLCVVHHSEVVVDLWGGFCDVDRSRPWERDTLVNVWSVTKVMIALAALVLVEHGELDLDAPVARYWPEFAQGGKHDVKVRQLLGHTAGLSGFTRRITVRDLCDWDARVTDLAAQEPWWGPGTASGYHAFTYGFLIGEVITRITGVSPGAFFASELAGPLGADFQIGVNERDDARVANMIAPLTRSANGSRPRGIALRTYLSPLVEPDVVNERWWRAAQIPAANGHGNARSVALVQSLVAGLGEAGGVRLLSPNTVARLFETQARGVDLVLGEEVHFGMGYGLDSSSRRLGPRAAYWVGYGGSFVVTDQDRDLTVAFAMNQMSPAVMGDARMDRLVAAANAAADAIST